MEIYANAPITEAALDIRIRGLVDIPDEILSTVTDPAYPELFQRPTTFQVHFEANPEKKATSATAAHAKFGYSYRSVDQRNIFQARADGFTHNRLAPYQEWKAFVTEARRLWEVYKSKINPEVVELIGLNYINDIEVPYGTDFSEYFKTYVEIPKELPQQLNVFSIGYQVPIPDDGGFLKIGQTYGIPKRDGFGVIRLNIQTFKPLQLAVRGEDDAQIWKSFETLRMAKSMAFEACITDKVREMIR